MPLKEFTGNAPATRLSGSLASGVTTTFSVITGGGTGYPTGATASFVVVVDRGTSLEEKILCSGRSGDVFTIAGSGRGYDDTTAQNHAAQAVVEHALDSATVEEANAHVNDDTRNDHSQYLRTYATGGDAASPEAVSQTTAAIGDDLIPAHADHVHVQAAATPRGVMGYAEKTDLQAVSNGNTDALTDLSVTFTAISGRRYRVSTQVLVMADAGEHAQVFIRDSGASANLANKQWYSGGALEENTVGFGRIITGITGSKTYIVRLTAIGSISAGGVANTNPAFLLVEDIGIGT